MNAPLRSDDKDDRLDLDFAADDVQDAPPNWSGPRETRLPTPACPVTSGDTHVAVPAQTTALHRYTTPHESRLVHTFRAGAGTFTTQMLQTKAVIFDVRNTHHTTFFLQSTHTTLKLTRCDRCNR